MAISIKTPDEIAVMRRSGWMLATVLDKLARQTYPGRTPKDMAEIARLELKKLGGQPAFLGFHGFPDVICISVNSQVQHTIPTNKPMNEGDVVNYDFGVKYKNMVTDGGISLCVGNHPSDAAARLLDGTRRALDSGLSKVKAGNRVGDISAAIEATLNKYRLGIVRELVGHGVGHQLHEDPEIPNYGRAGTGPHLEAGMTIAIEPISTLGRDDIVGDPDGWTIWTKDGSWSAQFEHTVLVTNDGFEILTQL
ncbi:MAG TPA: type I methionyl aminopeptidase [Candidatus Saccharimonadales bacterium]|nr:type I methionyl aminopeptidase [Candidatus Saccharimonadales bacterium]